jgi:hypothetical protein
MGSHLGGYNKGISCMILNFAEKNVMEETLCTGAALSW